MRKYIGYALILVISALLAWCFIPRSCSSDVEYTDTEYRVMKANILDSILNVQELKYQAVQDSIIREFNKKDSVHRLEYAALKKGYDQQRSLIKHLKVIRVDSVSQVVDTLSVIDYNALVESGNKCDSMRIINEARIADKDTTIKALENKFESEKKLTDSAEAKAEKYLELTEDEKKKTEKVKKINKLLIKIIIVETAIIAIVAIII